MLIQNNGAGESACVLRIHHSLADGISMLHVVEEIITQVDGSPVETILPPGIHKKFRVKVPLLKLIWSSIKAVIEVLTLSITPYDDDTVFSVTNKDMVSLLVLQLYRLRAMRQTSCLLLPFGIKIHTGKRDFVMLEPMPLDFIKDLKNAANVTINDVMFSCLSQTIHDYLEEQKCPVLDARGEELQCRALITVGIPPSAEVAEDKTRVLRNKW